MKKLTLLFILTTVWVLHGCKVNPTPVNPITITIIEKIVDGWCETYCDYPKSVQEVLTDCEENDGWKSLPIKDSVETALSFLQKEEKHIVWSFCRPTLTTVNLTILYYEDTIYKKTEKFLFPGLDVSLYSYSLYHLEYPDSIEDLIAYNSLSNCLQQGFYQCNDETFDYILKNKDMINWQKRDGSILIIAGEDTIAAQGFDPKIQYCDDEVVSNKVVFRFFDTEGRYAQSETIEKDLKTGLSELQKNFKPILSNQLTWHILEYTPKNGLQLFCENDNLALDTEWFHAVDEYMYSFCDKYGLGRIIFTSPSFQK